MDYLKILIVEAAHRSGSLITADQALEQGRMFIFIPGILQVLPARNDHLIQQGAKLNESRDILEDIDTQYLILLKVKKRF